MSSALLIRDAAALRHTFQVKKRLQLEFLAALSKLMREYGVNADDELIGSLILAVPEEIMNGSYASSIQLAQETGGYGKNGKKRGVGPQPADKPGVGPQPGQKPGVGPQPGQKPGVGPQPANKPGVGPQPGPRTSRKPGVGPQPKKGSGKGKK